MNAAILLSFFTAGAKRRETTARRKVEDAVKGRRSTLEVCGWGNSVEAVSELGKSESRFYLFHFFNSVFLKS